MNHQQSTIHIALVKESEYQSWLFQWQHYLAFYQTELPETVTATTWERFLNPHEQLYCAVAKNEAQIIGFVTFLYHRSTWAMEGYCYLEDLFVEEQARGQKVGQRLIEFVTQHAQTHHASRLYWHTHEMNHQAHRLYDQIGHQSGMIEYRKLL